MHSMTQQQVRMAKATAGELDDVLRVLQAGVEQARNPPTSVVAGTYMRFPPLTICQILICQCHRQRTSWYGTQTHSE